jgi:ankyrin repeat protein
MRAGDHAEAVRWLCAKGCWVDAPDAADNTPLHLAARGLPVVQPKANINTGMLVAPLKHAGKAVRSLLAAAAKPEVRNARQLTPLGEAVVFNNVAALLALLEANALPTVTIKR